jgi:hypothetical protein
MRTRYAIFLQSRLSVAGYVDIDILAGLLARADEVIE